MAEYRRGQIWWANLNPIKGSEQGGIRPVLVLQNNIANKYSPVVIVAILSASFTEKDLILQTNVFVNSQTYNLQKDSIIVCNQIRTIDKSRLTEYISTIDKHLMPRVDIALQDSLGLNICYYCEAPIIANKIICVFCKKIVVKKCSNCGNINKNRWLYCPHCGTSMQDNDDVF